MPSEARLKNLKGWFSHKIKAGLPAGLKKKNHDFEEKNALSKKALFSLLFILKSSFIMFIRQNVQSLHVY